MDRERPSGTTWRDPESRETEAANIVEQPVACQIRPGSPRGRRHVALPCGDRAAYDFPMDMNLPGAELIEAGIADLRRGEETIAALLVSIGAARLARLGLAIPRPIAEPEERLYALLAADNPATAHGRYNGFVRRLVSFERAAECAS
jgi:hypothetical protein